MVQQRQLVTAQVLVAAVGSSSPLQLLTGTGIFLGQVNRLRAAQEQPRATELQQKQVVYLPVQRSVPACR